MNDLIIVVIRFLLYLDLTTLFGLSFLQIYGMGSVGSEMHNLINFRSLIALAVLVGILLTGMNMLLVSNIMSGVIDFRELSIHIIEMVIEKTNAGIGWVVRLFTLFITLGGLFLYAKNKVSSCLLMTISGAAVLATLAWDGYAVMHNDVYYYLHLFSDLTHPGAAGVWTGAPAVFAILLTHKDNYNVRSVSIISGPLAKFAAVETVVVVALSPSTPANHLYIAEGGLAPLPSNAWGGISLAKTALFVLMLLLTAANRLYLGPRLEVMIREGSYVRSVALTRNSILTEFVIAVAILRAVSWLGMLAPSQASWDTEGVSRKILTIMSVSELCNVY